MTVQTAILGFAHGHVNAYCDAWKQQPEMGVSVLAAWDHDTARLEQMSASLGLKAHTDLDELLSHTDIQAVIIAAETSMHAELVERAAEKGKAIVLQKPLSLTLAEADRIVDAVNRHQVPFTMAWQMRADPQNMKMKELLESGEFGQVFMVRRRHGLPVGLSPDFADSWHVSPEFNRDIWADDSSHPIDFIHWMLGVPESVTAEVMSLYNPRIPMDNGVALFKYPNGPLAEVNCSFTCAAGENTTEIICERGTIVQNFGDATSANVPRSNDGPGLKWYLAEQGKWVSSEIDSPPNHGFRIRGLAEPIADFLNGRRGPIATAEEGRTSLRMVLACYVSSREGRRVPLDDASIAEV